MLKMLHTFYLLSDADRNFLDYFSPFGSNLKFLRLKFPELSDADQSFLVYFLVLI